MTMGFTGPLWVFAVSAAVYIFVYTGFEIIIIAAAIDAYFGYASGGWFIYTLCTTVGLLLTQWGKPYLTMYNQS
jgi:hypothetical protein